MQKKNKKGGGCLQKKEFHLGKEVPGYEIMRRGGGKGKK